MGASREHNERFAARVKTMSRHSPSTGPTHVPAAAEKPTTVAECANGGWKELGFPDYGACIVFVLSRPPGSGKA
jgi:hypothetical protein